MKCGTDLSKNFFLDSVIGPLDILFQLHVIGRQQSNKDPVGYGHQFWLLFTSKCMVTPPFRCRKSFYLITNGEAADRSQEENEL